MQVFPTLNLVAISQAAVEKKLMEYSEVTGLYRTTEAGLVFLKKHEQLCLLFPAISDLPEISKFNPVVSESYSE